MQALHDQLIKHEGLRLKMYKCTEGKTTIGIGHNLTDNGITEEMARFIFEKDLDDCFFDLDNKIFPGKFRDNGLPEPIKMVLMDMRFQLGPNRFRKFKKMIQAVKDDNPKEMIVQMRDSRWYRQTTERAEDLIGMVEVFI